MYLCAKYDAHINVEICTSIQSIKYVYKYVFKGHDRTYAAIVQQRAGAHSEGNNRSDEPVDEIKTFLDARYVSASEGCWDLFSFSLHNEFPSHQRLAVHLGDEKIVHFEEDEDPEAIVRRAHETTLIGWFQFNQQHQHSRDILYPDFPEQHVFVPLERRWKIRERDFGGTIGRVYAVYPCEVEKYHLRLLLYHVPGATSFEDLRTINSGTPEQQVLPSFQAAARPRALLTDQQEWSDCLDQVVAYQYPNALRHLSAVILVFSPYVNAAI